MMTLDDIEQIKADIEEGTLGPWETHKRNDEDEATLVISDENNIADCSSFITGVPIGVDAANARRIARVPELEAEMLRLREANEALIKANSLLLDSLFSLYGVTDD